MRVFRTVFELVVCALCATNMRAEVPAIELEVAVDSGSPFGTQQKWYALLKELDVASLRLREVRRGEKPSIQAGGSERAPRYRLTAIVTARNELLLPGGRFSERDRGRLAAYLKKLQEEGIDGVTASRGMFGLTEKQFAEVHEELSRTIGFSTAGKRPREVIDAIADGLRHRLVMDQALVARLDRADALESELSELSRGTGLAILLAQAGLEFQPKMAAGELLYQIAAAHPEQNRGKSVEALNKWPIGWESNDIPGNTVPELFQIIDAEIDGYTLAEALDAITSRLEVPVVLDRRSLKLKGVDMASTQVKLPAGRYSYDRILSRVLFQGGLKGTIRVDEQGTPFYWITTL